MKPLRGRDLPSPVNYRDPFCEAVPAVVVADARPSLPKRLALVGIGLLVVALAVLGYRQASLVLDQSEQNAALLREAASQREVLVDQLEAQATLIESLRGIVAAQQDALEEAGLVPPGVILLPGGVPPALDPSGPGRSPRTQDARPAPPAPAPSPSPRPAPQDAPGPAQPAPAPPPAPAPAPAVPAPVDPPAILNLPSLPPIL